MTGSQEPREVSEADLDAAVARLFGRHDQVSQVALDSACREAGFDEEQSRRGVQMVESGAYFDFIDAATSLRVSFGAGPLAGRVCEASIAEAAKRLEVQS